jgi:hypothetical protein
MARWSRRLLAASTVAAGAAAAGDVGLVTGACPLDVGIGRRVRPLGPQLVEVAARREAVFDLIAEPYLGRTPRALADKVRVLERGSDMVLAAHVTPLGGGWGWLPRRWRRCASPGPSGSTSGWSAARSPTWSRRSRWRSSPMVPARCWATRGSWPPTCGAWANGGAGWSPAAGSRRWRPRWQRSRRKPNGGPQPPRPSASAQPPAAAGGPLRSGRAAPRRHIPTPAGKRLVRVLSKQDEFRRRWCADMGADHCSSDQPSASPWICWVRNRRSASVAASWAARSNAACAASGCPSRRNIVPRAACSR